MDESERSGRQALGDEMPLPQYVLMTIAKTISLAVVLVVTVILGVSWPLVLDGTAPLQATRQTRDSEAIVVKADVKDWEPMYPDGPIDSRAADRQINVVRVGGVIIGQHHFIVRFKVAGVVHGQFDS
jgi:hypothetical protein